MTPIDATPMAVPDLFNLCIVDVFRRRDAWFGLLTRSRAWGGKRPDQGESFRRRCSRRDAHSKAKQLYECASFHENLPKRYVGTVMETLANTVAFPTAGGFLAWRRSAQPFQAAVYNARAWVSRLPHRTPHHLLSQAHFADRDWGDEDRRLAPETGEPRRTTSDVRPSPSASAFSFPKFKVAGAGLTWRGGRASPYYARPAAGRRRMTHVPEKRHAAFGQEHA